MGRTLKVRVEGDSSGIDQMVRELDQKLSHAGEKIQKEFTGIPSAFAGGFAAMFSIGALKEFVGGVIEAGNQIKDTSEQFDISTDSVQKWEKALAKAGVSSNTFYRSLETLRMKREDARSDEKKRGPFEDVGLLSQALDGSVSDEDLLRMILKGNSRTAINELLGRRGATLKPASEELDTISPTFSPEDIRRLDNIHKGSKAFWGSLKAMGSQSLIGLLGLGKMGLQGLGLMEQDPAESLVGTYTRKRSNELNARYEARENERMAKARKEREAAKKQAEQQAKVDKMREGHEERMADLSRGTMERDEQKVALKQEELKVRRQIEDLELKKELTPEEQERLMHLQERQQSIKNSLYDLNRERPGTFAPTQLERLGAVSANSLLFNPMLQINQQQLGVLRNIETILREKKDPFEL